MKHKSIKVELYPGSLNCCTDPWISWIYPGSLYCCTVLLARVPTWQLHDIDCIENKHSLWCLHNVSTHYHDSKWNKIVPWFCWVLIIHIKTRTHRIFSNYFKQLPPRWICHFLSSPLSQKSENYKVVIILSNLINCINIKDMKQKCLLW